MLHQENVNTGITESRNNLTATRMNGASCALVKGSVVYFHDDVQMKGKTFHLARSVRTSLISLPFVISVANKFVKYIQSEQPR